jgi:hypothetical protein
MVEDGMIFAHLVSVASWNLISRSGNVVEILNGHLGAEGDHILAWFAHMKGDQMGKHSRLPRALFANPLRPEICFYLALALYYLEYPAAISTTYMFEGEHQYERFIKVYICVCG